MRPEVNERTNREVTEFVTLSFALSWAVWVPLVFVDPPGYASSAFWDLAKNAAAWAPSLSALALTAVWRGYTGVVELLVGLAPRSALLRWYAGVVLAPPAAVLAAIGLATALGFGTGAFPSISSLSLVVIVFMYVLVLGGPLGAEIGWRGYALPRLLTRHSPLRASLILGAVAAVWHLPLFFISWAPQASMPFGSYALLTVSVAVAYTWVYLKTGGELLPAVLLHTAINTAVGILPVISRPGSGVPQMTFLVLTFLAAMVAVVIATRPVMRTSPESPASTAPFSHRERAVLGVAATLLVALLAVEAWALTPLGPSDQALAALAIDEVVHHESGPDGDVFRPARGFPRTGLVLYPGGRVDPRSYAALARDIAAQGYLVIVPPMPLNLAVLSPERAKAVIVGHPEVQSWAVGGHSLGGAMAAQYAERADDKVLGLVLLAAYAPETVDLASRDLRALSLTASEDGVLSWDSWRTGRARLPKDTRHVEISGGNHAQFGSYGDQPGDGDATLTEAEQRQMTAREIATFLQSISQTPPLAQ